MRKLTYLFVLVVVFVPLIDLDSAQGQVGNKTGCYSGFSKEIEDLRAAQRALGCRRSGSIQECEFAMGLGLGGIVGVSKRIGKEALGRTANKVRDSHFHFCAVNNRRQIFKIFGPELAWAAGNCTREVDLLRNRLLESIDAIDEGTRGLVTAGQQANETIAKLVEELEKQKDPQKHSALVQEIRSKSLENSRKSAEAALRVYNGMVPLADQNKASSAARSAESAKTTFYSSLPEFAKREIIESGAREEGYRSYSMISDQTMKRWIDGLPDHQRNRIMASFRALQQDTAEAESARKVVDLADKTPKVQAALRAIEAAEKRVSVFSGMSDLDLIGQLKKELTSSAQMADDLKLRSGALKELRVLLSDPSINLRDIQEISHRLFKFVPDRVLTLSPESIGMNPSQVSELSREIGSVREMGIRLLDRISHIKPSPKVGDFLGKYSFTKLDSMAKALTTASSYAAVRGSAMLLIGGIASLPTLALAHVGDSGVVCDEADSKSMNFGTNKLALECKKFSLDQFPIQKIVELSNEELCSRILADADFKSDWQRLVENMQGHYLARDQKLSCKAPQVLSGAWGSATVYSNQIVMTMADRSGFTEPAVVNLKNGFCQSIRYRSGRTIQTSGCEDESNSRSIQLVNTFKGIVLPSLVEGRACCNPGAYEFSPDADYCSKRYAIRLDREIAPTNMISVPRSTE